MPRDRAGGESGGAVPGWVKLIGLLALAVIVVVVVLLVSGHRPGRHLGADIERDGVGASQTPAAATGVWR